MMNGIQFQSVQTPNALSSELRSVIRDNVLQFYVQGNGMDAQEEGITALYERLSQEDKLDGESNSIANQKIILMDYAKKNGYLHPQYFVDDGISGTTFVSNRQQLAEEMETHFFQTDMETATDSEKLKKLAAIVGEKPGLLDLLLAVAG